MSTTVSTKTRPKNLRSKYEYTVLHFCPRTKERSYGKFFSTRDGAESHQKYLRKAFPHLKFTVAAIRIHPDGQS